MVCFIMGMVVVSKAERATISALCSVTAFTNVSGATSTPKSTSSNPELSIIIFTRFFPISWRSPFTVPMTTFPTEMPSPSPSMGLSISRAALIHCAAMRTSGMNISPLCILSPTTSIPLIRPWLSTSPAASPALIAELTALSTADSSPLINASVILL